jgi:small subunit ribosomal protein S1
MENGVSEKGLENKAVDKVEDQETPGWFQEVIETYDIESPKQGDILKGTILDIGENSILLDVGLKRDAIVTSQDLDKIDEEILKDLEEGMEVFVSVLRTPVGDEDLIVSLNRGIAYKNWVKAEELMDSGEIVELEVIDQNRGGVLVTFDKLRGFVPNSHIPALRRGSSSQKMEEIKGEIIGDTLPLKVIEVNRKQRRLVFSARVAQKEQRKKRLEELQEGDVIKSRVVNVVDFGVFVDLHGVDGLVHKSEIAWDRVYDPSKYFSVGDEIEVKVVDVDVERERVSLSRKDLLPNPWEKLQEKYDEGDLVEGKVVSVLDFGAFVELPEGLQGLVHVSELGYANMGDPKSVVRVGDEVLVRVMNIEPDRERVSLSMRRVPVDEQLAWMMDEEEEEEPEEEPEEVAEEEPAAEASDEEMPEEEVSSEETPEEETPEEETPEEEAPEEEAPDMEEAAEDVEETEEDEAEPEEEAPEDEEGEAAAEEEGEAEEKEESTSDE